MAALVATSAPSTTLCTSSAESWSPTAFDTAEATKSSTSPRVSVPASPAVTWDSTIRWISAALTPSGTDCATALLIRPVSSLWSISGAGSARIESSTMLLTSAAESWAPAAERTIDSTSARVSPGDASGIAAMAAAIESPTMAWISWTVAPCGARWRAWSMIAATSGVGAAGSGSSDPQATAANATTTVDANINTISRLNFPNTSSLLSMVKTFRPSALAVRRNLPIGLTERPSATIVDGIGHCQGSGSRFL